MVYTGHRNLQAQRKWQVVQITLLLPDFAATATTVAPIAHEIASRSMMMMVDVLLRPRYIVERN